MKEAEPLTKCNRQTLVDGNFVTCPGTIEVRVPVYFDRSVQDEELTLVFAAVGGTDDTEGIAMDCTECGKPAPRVYYAGIAPVLVALNERLAEVLA